MRGRRTVGGYGIRRIVVKNFVVYYRIDEKMHQDGGCSGRGRDILPVQVQMNKEAAHPACLHAKKTWYELLRAGASNITPAPSTDTCGQCRSTDKRRAGGRDRHRASQRTTQTPNHSMAFPSAGRGRGQKRRTRPDTRNRPRQFPVRTHIPKIQNTLRPYMIYIRPQPPMGDCAGSSDLSAFQNWEFPASAGAAENARPRMFARSWAGVFS